MQRHFGENCSAQVSTNDIVKTEEKRMSPGLTGEYDWELREKAGMHQPPPPPEYMGLEGEYDENGLAKRVAAAFDRDSQIEDMETLHIVQNGSTIVLEGSVPKQAILEHITDVAASVDGTKAVDTSQVTIAAS
jgi:osmotically-inducible protein OsmY